MILALAAIALFGAGLVRAGFARRASGPAEVALRLALALSLGLGAWSSAYAAQWLAFGARGTAVKDACLALTGAALLVFSRQAPAPQPRPDDAPRWLAALFWAACALCAALFVEHSLRFPDGGWDAWMVWNLRARFLARAADARAAFSPHLLFWAHQDYPWMVPGAVAQAFLAAGESYAAPAALAFVYGALTVAVLSASLARLHGSRAGFLGGLALCSTPCFVLFAASQASDVPLALHLLAAAALLELGDSPRAFALAGFSAGLCAWTKNEGAVYAAALAVGLAVRRREGLRPFLAGALPGIALLLAFKMSAPSSPLLGESAAARALDPQRWLQVLLLGLRRIFYFQDLALWAAAFCAAAALRFRRLLAHPLGVALGLSFAACAGVYLIQPQPLEWLFRTTADRLFIELWPSAILLTLPALRPATART